MRVHPASSMPRLAGKFVIVNLQKTGMDEHATLVIHEKIDVVTKLLM